MENTKKAGRFRKRRFCGNRYIDKLPPVVSKVITEKAKKQQKTPRT